MTTRDGKLTGRLAGISPRQAMEQVGRLSGVEIRWIASDPGQENVWADFSDLPLSDVIRRMLRGRDFVLLYTSGDEGTRLTEIWIISPRADGRQAFSRPPLPQAETAPLDEAPADVEPPLEALIQTAISDAGLASRLDAIEALGRYAREEARAREILFDLAQNDGNPQVRDVASAALGTPIRLPVRGPRGRANRSTVNGPGGR